MSDLQPAFDWDALDPQTRAIVAERTEEIRTFGQRACQDIIEVGKRLISVKGCLNHGQFTAWLDTEFGMSRDTANRFMQAARVFPQMPQFAVFDVSALYRLAAPSTPAEVRQEFIQRAEAGERITHAAVKESVVGRHPAPAAAAPRTPESRIVREPVADDLGRQAVYDDEPPWEEPARDAAEEETDDGADPLPFMDDPAWKPYRVLEAKEHLGKLPERERPKAARLINKPAIPPQDGIRMLRNLAGLPEPARQRIYRLDASADPRDRDRAITDAADAPPMPDRRLAHVRDAIRELRKAIDPFPEDPETPRLNEIVGELEAMVASIKGRRGNERDADHAQTPS